MASVASVCVGSPTCWPRACCPLFVLQWYKESRAHGRLERLAGLGAVRYRHHVSVIKTSSDPAHEAMPRVPLVASLLRWLLGTLQGGIQHQHLNYYLDEFTFRFNRRPSKARGLLFHRLAEQAVAGGPRPTAKGEPENPSQSEEQGQ